MIKIAIVEDEKKYADTLTEHINSFGNANGVAFTISRFDNAVDFLTVPKFAKCILQKRIARCLDRQKNSKGLRKCS